MRNLRAALVALFAVTSCGESGSANHHEEPHHESGEHEQTRWGAVRISTAAIARTGIELGTVTAGVFHGGIEVPAEVKPEPDGVAHVSALVSGQLARVDAKIGAHVKKGTVLAALDSVQLGKARSKLARARATAEVAQKTFERQQTLQRENIGARREYLEAEAELKRAQAELSAARRALRIYGRGGEGSTILIRSPIAGQVIERHATVGEVVGPDDVLFQIIDTTRVWVVGRAYQQHAGAIREGAVAVLSLAAYPGRSWKGTVGYVAPAVDQDTRTLPIRVVLENPEGLLRPGLFGTLAISPPNVDEKPVPIIDGAAVQRVDGQTVVFVPGKSRGEFRAVPVALGATNDGRAHVLDGLEPGDRYVVRGAFVLKSELLRARLGEGHAH